MVLQSLTFKEVIPLQYFVNACTAESEIWSHWLKFTVVMLGDFFANAMMPLESKATHPGNEMRVMFLHLWAMAVMASVSTFVQPANRKSSNKGHPFAKHPNTRVAT